MPHSLYLLFLSTLFTVFCAHASKDEKNYDPIPSIEKTKQNNYTGKPLTLNFQDISIRQVIAILAEFTGKNIVVSEEVTGNITLKLDNIPWDEALDFIMITKELGQYQSGNVTLIAPLDKIRAYREKLQQMEEAVEKSDPLITEYIKINYAKGETLRNILNGVNPHNLSSCETDQTSANHVIGASDAANLSFHDALNEMQGKPSTSYKFFPYSLLENNGPNNRGELKKNTIDNLDDNNFLSSRGTVVVDARTNTLIVKDTAKKVAEVKN